MPAGACHRAGQRPDPLAGMTVEFGAMLSRPVCLQHGVDLGDDVGGRCGAVEILELAQALLALVEAVEKFVMRLVDGGNVGNAGTPCGVGQPGPPSKKPPA